MLNKRKIEIIALERERIVRRSVTLTCPVCNRNSELLTTRQTGALLQVRAERIYRWLAQGKIHSVRTPGGQHRVCRRSLFLPY